MSVVVDFHLTLLCHSSAWEVDFNMPLKSFIPQLQGVQNLIDLALSSELEKVPPLVFASSISDVQSKSVSSKALCLLTVPGRSFWRRLCPSKRK